VARLNGAFNRESYFALLFGSSFGSVLKSSALEFSKLQLACACAPLPFAMLLFVDVGIKPGFGSNHVCVFRLVNKSMHCHEESKPLKRRQPPPPVNNYWYRRMPAQNVPTPSGAHFVPIYLCSLCGIPQITIGSTSASAPGFDLPACAFQLGCHADKKSLTGRGGRPFNQHLGALDVGDALDHHGNDRVHRDLIVTCNLADSAAAALAFKKPWA
jgi:hypothetical protein